MEHISSDYQNALNTTKLVYDYYGAGDSDMALTYGLLMTPSVYNDYYPKLVTDQKNRVILNASYAAAARAAGIPAEGLSGTPSSTIRNKFIDALASEGIITPNKAAVIQSTTYGNTIGLGDTISVNQATTNVSYDQLLDLFDNYADASDVGGVLLGSSALQNNCSLHDGSNQQQHFIKVLPDGTVQDHHKQSQSGSVTISELLSGDAQFMIAYESGSEPIPYDQAYQIQQDITGTNPSGSTNILDWITNQFMTVLGGTAASETAIQYAYNSVFDLIYPSDGIKNAQQNSSPNQDALNEAATESGSKKGWDNGFHTDTAKQSPNYMGMNYFYVKETGGLFHKGGNEETTISINLNNIAKAFMTSYVQYMQGVEESPYYYQKGNINNCKLFDGEKDDFEFTIPVDTEIDDDDTQLYANFYDAMFNTICLNGWSENDQIDDEDYMAEMLKGGMAFISTISDDGFYYQGSYSTDRAILEVADDEAISKAEAKYNTEKAKIENKEQTIDMKMKNLDTEISSLTTEYDTTKQVITKAIEKSFKRYDA